MHPILSSLFKETIDDYIDVETGVGNTIVFSGGQLASIIEIHGVYNVMNGNDMNDVMEQLTLQLQGYMDAGGHQIQFVFAYDPDTGKDLLHKALGPAKAVCKRVGVDESVLIDDQITRMEPVTANEYSAVILYTDFANLTKAERREHLKKVSGISKKIPASPYTQNLFVESDIIMHQHKSFVTAVMEDFSHAGIRVSLQNARQAVFDMRLAMEPDVISDDWSPYMPGDKIPLRVFKNGSVVGIPRISEQLLTSAPEISGHDVIVGSRVYRPMLMTLPPKNVKLFSELLSRVPQDIPWRMSIHIQGNVINGMGFRMVLATLLKAFSDTNKRTEKGIRALQQMSADNIDTIIGMRMGFMTWSNKDNMEQLESRASVLTRSVEGWGECRITNDIGDPFETFVGMTPAMSRSALKSSMPAAPLADVMPMFPFFRPAVPWDYGFLTFASLDDKLLPFEMASGIQANWNTLIFAPPGSGKSVLMLNMVLALIFRAGNASLPKIGIIDIGPTSRGLIDFLQSILPEHLKHLVGRYRLQFNDKYTINILDTMLGKREPLPLDREFLVNIISMLATPSGRSEMYANTAEIIGAAIDEAYIQKSDMGANRYDRDEDERVDKLLDSYGYHPDNSTTWWEIVDYLFGKGHIEEASLAQRFAVPLLSDVSRIIEQDAGIRDLYMDDTVPGESVKVTSALSRNIQASIREFGIFSKPTTFSVDSMRIVALDLDEVAKGGSKKSSVMYLVARYALARTFYFDEDYIDLFPPEYHSYYRQFFMDNKGMFKGLFMDEIHRTRPISGKSAASEIVRAQIKTDMREGRKFSVVPVLASQEFVDFDDEMIDLASTRVIMGYGSKKEVNEITEHLGLPVVAKTIIMRYVNGPGARGSNFVMNYKTKEGEFTQALNFKVSGQRLWSLSTTSEDDIIKRELSKHMSFSDALKVLGKRFPGGSAKKAIEEQLISDTGNDSTDLTEDEVRNASIRFAHEILKSELGDVL